MFVDNDCIEYYKTVNKATFPNLDDFHCYFIILLPHFYL